MSENNDPPWALGEYLHPVCILVHVLHWPLKHALVIE